MWSADNNPQQLLASTGTDWAALQQGDAPWEDTVWSYYFSVNRAGVALSTSILNPCDVVGATCPGDELDVERDVTTDFSVDLTNWTTIEGRDD